MTSERGPRIGKEDEFEAVYKDRFRIAMHPQGLLVFYERDRAAIDIGVHLTNLGDSGSHVSHTRIWFQLKGLHSKTLSKATFAAARDVPIQVELAHLRFWFASPEPIYLAVYVEAADLFLAEDVREIVYRMWGESFYSPGTFEPDQKSVVVRLGTQAILSPERVLEMRRHQSMRIDGPYFRGRSLGHKLDPLRCSLDAPDPTLYTSIINRLLQVNDYRPESVLAPSSIYEDRPGLSDEVSLTQGKLYGTLEWVPQDFTEFGIGPDGDYRIEGAPQFAHGPVAVCIDGAANSSPDPTLLKAFLASLEEKRIPRLLVFANTNSNKCFGSFFSVTRLSKVACMPHLLRDLGYSLLTATIVYLEFRERVSWQMVNYLWK